MKLYKLVILVSVLFSWSANASQEVRFQAGEMSLPDYIEMVADGLGLVINSTNVEDSASNRVQIAQSETLNKDQAMTKLLSVLHLRRFTFVHDEDLDSYRILDHRDARDANIPLFMDEKKIPDNDLLITYMTTLKHYPADGVARVLRNFMPPNTRIIAMDQSNTLLFTDAARSMARFKALITKMDTPEAAAQVKEYLRAHAKDDLCSTKTENSQSTTNLVLFSFVALIFGFLIRGYMIRRIEGGL